MKKVKIPTENASFSTSISETQLDRILPRKNFSEKEAAKEIGISVPTLQRIRATGAIGFFRVSNRVIYSESHIAEYLIRCERKAA